MNTEEVIDIFKETGAFLEGHFILSSGLHSGIFLQKARVFMHPDKTEKLFASLAQKVKDANWVKADYLVGPAVGGIIPVYEMARHYGAPAIWVEREKGTFQLRRFEIEKGAKVIIVEDIISTGLSVRETIECMENLGAEVVGVTCIIDRSAGKAEIGAPLISLAQYEVEAYPADELPEELLKIPATKPGSRALHQ